MIKSLWASVQSDPVFMRRANGWLTIIWLAAAVPICLLLSNSVPFLVFISVYAVVTGHLSAWQAARVEVVQQEDADVAEVLEAVEEISPGSVGEVPEDDAGDRHRDVGEDERDDGVHPVVLPAPHRSENT